jgi:hypothetical protein
MLLFESFDWLENEEKAALWGAITDNPQIGRLMLEKLKPGYGRTTYYKYYNQGIDSLKKKELLDSENNPTKNAIALLSGNNLKQAIKELREQLIKTKEKCQELNAENGKLVYDYSVFMKQHSELKQELDILSPLKPIIESFQKLGINQNWIRASIALNIVEPAIKNKIESLGVILPDKTDFTSLYDLLQQTLINKEHRKLKPKLFTPTMFYKMRSELDHWGHKYTEISKEEADYIVLSVNNFLDDLMI